MTDVKTVLLRWTPRARRLVVLVGLCAMALLVVMFIGGFLWGRAESQELRHKYRQLVADYHQQSREVLAGEQQVALLAKSAEVDRLAAAQVQRELADLRLEVAALKRDVEFYRGLMAPSERDKGFQLHSVKVEQREEGVIGYRLMLTNIGGRGQVVKGALSLELEFLENGEAKTQPVTLLPDYAGENPIKLRFRFFQQVEGSFRLPENTEPLNLVLSSDVKDATGSPYFQSLAWSELF